MAVNKVVYNTEKGSQTLIDLTSDTVTPETLAEGATAHDASGKVIVGTMASPKMEWSEDLLPTSVDTDGSIYNGVGYIDGYRLNSSGTLSAESTARTTGHIPVKRGEMVKLEVVNNTMFYINYLYHYDEAFTKAGYTSVNNQLMRDGVFYFHAFFDGYIRFSYTSLPASVRVQKGVIPDWFIT